MSPNIQDIYFINKTKALFKIKHTFNNRIDWTVKLIHSPKYSGWHSPGLSIPFRVPLTGIRWHLRPDSLTFYEEHINQKNYQNSTDTIHNDDIHSDTIKTCHLYYKKITFLITNIGDNLWYTAHRISLKSLIKNVLIPLK